MDKYLTVVIVAAGSSSRLKNKIPKPFINIKGKPILWYSVNAFNKLEFVKDIFIVISSENFDHAIKFHNKYLTKINKFNNFIYGGKERADSIYNALMYFEENNTEPDYIAIHDAARPFIKEELIRRIWENTVKYDAASPGVIPVDTIKIAEKGFIKSHTKRSSLIAIQTPQTFKYKKILNAYKKAYKKGANFTDDTEIYGKIYSKIKIIESDDDLMKITYKKDLIAAKKILKENKELCK